MLEELAPGVYIEEIPGQLHPIQGVSTSTVGFIGAGQQASAAVIVTSFGDFVRAVGSSASGHLPIAVKGFFENGGSRCSVALIAPADALQAGLDVLASEDISILCCPDENRFPNAAAVLAARCEQRRDRVCILQSPQPVMPDATHEVPVHSSYAAYYYPWQTVVGLDGVTSVAVPPDNVPLRHHRPAWAEGELSIGTFDTVEQKGDEELLNRIAERTRDNLCKEGPTWIPGGRPSGEAGHD
jgi:hypothetical protein